MIPKECKRLAEVDFPIAEVSKHAAREKSIRHGHPSTLHLWWARRPLGSSRAVLMALLLPDPCDPKCPEDFKRQSREILSEVRQPPRTDEDLQKALFWFIGSFANWDLTSESVYLRVARNLIRSAHPTDPPLVIDPFAGGATIPSEALRIGCEALGTDLNPVANLVGKIMLEDIPRHAPGIVDDLERLGRELDGFLAGRLARAYPSDPDRRVPLAYLWARTVRCESPNCGAEIPIYRSSWLCRKGADKAKFFREDAAGSCVALLLQSAPLGGPIEFRVARGIGSNTAKAGFTELFGTKAPGNNANVICPCCSTVLPGNKKNPRVPEQLSLQSGGGNPILDTDGKRIGGAYLLAVVLRAPDGGKEYRLASERDYEAWGVADEELTSLVAKGGTTTPDEPLPAIGTLGFRVQRYGMRSWSDVFSSRQQLALLSVAEFIRERPNERASRLLAAVLGRCADYWSTGAMWAEAGEFVAHTFGRQALPLVWDFAEVVPTADGSGSLTSALGWVLRVVRAWPAGGSVGQSSHASALQSPLPDQGAAVWFTDPPYYNAIPYADLSDFFFIWHKRALPQETYLRDPGDLNNPLTPKNEEAVQDESKTVDGQVKDRAFFEGTMGKAFAEGRRVLREDGVGCVVFAHKTTEGWEALLSGMIWGGWTITASWPIATERPGRLRSQNSAALETSVHLVCRPRAEDAAIGDWADVLRDLPGRVHTWIERLQGEGMRGADLVFACIGPALEVFSQYRAVETAEAVRWICLNTWRRSGR